MEHYLKNFILSGALVALIVAFIFTVVNLEAFSARWTLVGYLFFTCNLLIWKPIVIGILNRPIHEENASKPKSSVLLLLILLKQMILITGAFTLVSLAPNYLLSITMGIVAGIFGGVFGLLLSSNKK